MSMRPGFGVLASRFGSPLPLQVCESAAGFYLGTMDEEGPVSRESMEYFPSREAAQIALDSGEWNQRENP